VPTATPAISVVGKVAEAMTSTTFSTKNMSAAPTLPTCTIDNDGGSPVTITSLIDDIYPTAVC
jgi:hypothetical protein